MRKIQYSGICERGMRDGVNQDVIGMHQCGKRGLFFVSDGMGGHCAGEKASGAIQAALTGWWQDYIADASLDFQDAIAQLRQLLADTHAAIQRDMADIGICGATLVLLFMQEDQYAVLWSGDSRCYLLEQRFFHSSLRQLTIDDTWENHLADGYTTEEMQRCPLFGKLLYAIGAGEEFSCHVQTGAIEGKALFALCSDGVYKYIEKEQLHAALRAALKKADVEGGIRRLRDLVYERDAPDNLSCVLVEII